MSFAGKVKEELLGQMGKARHCQLAELAAFFAVCGQIYMNEEGECQVKFVTENLTVAKKCYMLVKRVFHIVPDVSVSGHHQYSLFLCKGLYESNSSAGIFAIFGGVYWTKSLLQPGFFKGSLFDKWFRYRPKQWVSFGNRSWR